jgi:uncharacterized SAM-binding protein YcdF (DUF218 family)
MTQVLVRRHPIVAGLAALLSLAVSDPLHIGQAMAMASRLGLRAEPAPTTSSGFRSTERRAAFLWRETWLYIDYLVLANPS